MRTLSSLKQEDSMGEIHLSCVYLSHLNHLCLLVRFLTFESIKELMSKLKVAHCAVQCTCEPILQQVSDCKHLVVFIIAGLMFDGRHNNHQ